MKKLRFPKTQGINRNNDKILLKVGIGYCIIPVGMQNTRLYSISSVCYFSNLQFDILTFVFLTRHF